MNFIPLKSLNNHFGINEQSEVINFKTGNILTPYIGIDLYQHIALKMNGKTYRKRVHRLMAEAFFNSCPIIDHIDENKSNNVLSNLRPITHSENIKRSHSGKSVNGGRGIWVIAEDKETQEKYSFKSIRQCELFTKIDRHRIKTFLEETRPNYTQWNFYYDR